MIFNKTKNEINDAIKDLTFQINLIKSTLENLVKESQSINTQNQLSLSSIKEKMEEDSGEIDKRMYELSEQNKTISENGQAINDKIIYLSEKVISDLEIKNNALGANVTNILSELSNTDKQLIELIKTLNDVNNERIDKIEQIAEDKDEEIRVLSASIQALAEGIYNKEHVEFFALKTYRGWKYICYNGESIKNFDDIKSIEMKWDSQYDKVQFVKELKDSNKKEA